MSAKRFLVGNWVRVMDGTTIGVDDDLGRVDLGDVIGKVVLDDGDVVEIALTSEDVNRIGRKTVQVKTECIVPFTLENQIVRAVFAPDSFPEDGGTGYADAPYRIKEDAEKDPITSALMVLVLSPHTRWVLSLIDPQGLGQADDALLDYQKIESPDADGEGGAPRPSLRALMLHRMEKIGEFQAERFKWVENPESAPEFLAPAVKALGHVAVKRWWIDEINRSSLELLALETILKEAGIIMTRMPHAETSDEEE